jgi:hypothetical protein
MRLLFPSAVLIGLSGSAALAVDVSPVRDMPVLNPNAGSPKSCPPTSRYQAARRGKTPDAQKLNELPAADLYSSVYRRVGGCEVPIIVRYNIGAGAENRSGKR